MEAALTVARDAQGERQWIAVEETEPAEYAAWLRLNAPVSGDGLKSVVEVLVEALSRGLERQGIPHGEIELFDIEARYGREKLKLRDGEQAVAMHTYGAWPT